MRLQSLQRLAVAAVLSLALVSCDSTAVSDSPGSLRVTSTFPDGSPATANVAIVDWDPARPPHQPDNHRQTARVTSGSHTFSGVPAGTYIVYTDPIWPQHTPDRIGMHTFATAVPEERVDVETFVGFREVDEWSTIASVEGRDPDDPWAPTFGVVQLVRYDLDALKIGPRHDLVHRVVTRGEVIAIVDEQATEALIAIYAIPDHAHWGFDDPGELTYDFFRTGMEPVASYTVPLQPMGAHNEAYIQLEIDPALFFEARNGIAILAEGQRLFHVDLLPHPLDLTYVWEVDS